MLRFIYTEYKIVVSDLSACTYIDEKSINSMCRSTWLTFAKRYLLNAKLYQYVVNVNTKKIVSNTEKIYACI